MLKVQSISKRFGEREVLKDISFSLEEGHIFGLLGTNGAGKSTLQRVLAGLYSANGTVLLDDQPVWRNAAARKSIAYLSDEPTFLGGTSIRDMAAMQHAYYDTQDDELLKKLCERFSLSMEDRIATFSKGTQKRAQIVLALSRQPKVLLCDETFDGLDPMMRDVFRKVLFEATVDRGLMTMLAGHNIQDMEGICDSVGFLHEGKMLTSGDLDTIRGEFYKLQCVLNEEPDEAWLDTLHPLRVQKQGRLLVLTLQGEREKNTALLQAQQPQYLETLPCSLEEVFILEMEAQGYAG